MKKIFILIALAAFLNACSDITVKTETTGADSTGQLKDSAPFISIDTNNKIMDKAKVLADSAGNKIERTADKIKEGADKIIEKANKK